MFSSKEIILSQITPALGCTEPAAIALNAAYLKEYCNDFSKIKLIINTNLLKNAMYVPIPNTNGKYGVKLAFALGLVCGNKEDGLNVFKNVDQNCVEKALKTMKNINLEIKEGNEIYIKSVTENCEVFTHKFHDNVEYAKINGEKISFSNKNEKEKKGTTEIEKWFKNQNFEIIYDFWKDDYSYLEETIKINMRLSEYGLTHSCALDINKRYRHTSLENKIKSYTVAASDARMEGVNLPAMSLCGSGNHGIAATLPVFIYGKEKGFNESEIYKAVGLSMMITTYVKLHIGRLSPICGAAFASGCGVAGAVTYLETKNREKSNNAISFMIETIMGVLCDGAKMGCSLKVLLGVENALNASKLAINDIKTYEDGILDRNITQSIKNLEKITTAMFPVDKAITEIMKKKVLN